MRQATSWHAPSSPDWIRYEDAEPLFYENFNPVVKAAVEQYAFNFGSDVSVMANHITVELEAQAIELLAEAGTIRAFSDMHIHSKIHQWVTHWCEYYGRLEEWGEERDQAEEKNAADRLAYIRTKYSEEAAARGTKARVANQKEEADALAREAQRLRGAGLKVVEIADRLVRSVRTVYRLLKRVVAVAVEAVKEVVKETTKSMTRGKGKVYTSSSSSNINKKDASIDKVVAACHKKGGSDGGSSSQQDLPMPQVLGEGVCAAEEGTAEPDHLLPLPSRVRHDGRATLGRQVASSSLPGGSQGWVDAYR